MRRNALLSRNSQGPAGHLQERTTDPTAKARGPQTQPEKVIHLLGHNSVPFVNRKDIGNGECPKNRWGPLFPKTTSINGVSWGKLLNLFYRGSNVTWKTSIKYSFMYEPECHSPSSGQEVLKNLNDQVGFSAEKCRHRVLPGQDFTLQAAPFTIGKQDSIRCP